MRSCDAEGSGHTKTPPKIEKTLIPLKTADFLYAFLDYLTVFFKNLFFLLHFMDVNNKTNILTLMIHLDWDY